MMRTDRLTRSLPGIASIILLVSLLGCGGGGGGSVGGAPPAAIPAAPVPAATAAGLPALSSSVEPCPDCWPMYAHDLSLSGHQTAQTGITSTTVRNLQLRWSFPIGEQVVSSPVIAEGSVFIVTGAGTVVAFDERTGAVQWRTQIGGAVSMSPAYSSGLLYVATHNPPAHFLALDARSGSIRWQTTFNGSIRGEPTIADGMVVIGEAGGDAPACHQGGVHAFQAFTGAALWTWHVNPTPNDGGSVWTPISFGGKDFVFGTGNSCSHHVANANSVIRLTPQGSQEWLFPVTTDTHIDDDWGGGAMISNGRIFVANKDGYFYSFDGVSGKLVWKSQLSPLDGLGALSTPATNGSIVVIGSGFISFPSVTNTPYSASVVAYSQGGAKLWSVPSGNRVDGGAAITNDVALVSIDLRVAALDINTGTELWSFPTPGGVFVQAPPVVVSSGAYAVDVNGTVYAFSLGAQGGADLRRAAAVVRQPSTVRMPYGPIIRRRADGLWLPVY